MMDSLFNDVPVKQYYIAIYQYKSMYSNSLLDMCQSVGSEDDWSLKDQWLTADINLFSTFIQVEAIIL